MKNKKICVYTCITGNYDNLKELKFKEKNIDYFCFTNNKNITSKTWNVIYISDFNLSNVLLARKHKILGNEIVNQYEWSIWIDGDIIIEKKLTSFVEKYCDLKNYKFIGFKHYKRTTIAEEMNACIQFKKENKEKIEKLKKFYAKVKFNDDCGLIESTIFIRNNNDENVKKTMKLWFDMLLKYSHRDQLTFNYCISETKLKMGWIPLNVWNNDWFTAEPHTIKPNMSNYRLYFGDSRNFDSDKVVDGNYNIDNELYSLSVTCPCDCTRIEYSVMNTAGVMFDNFKINSFKKIEYYNYYLINNLKIFYNDNAIILIEGNFKKHDKIDIHIKMKKLSTTEILNLCNDYKIDVESGYNNYINKLNEKIDYLNNKIYKIENSKGWKLLEIFRKIKSKFVK